MNTTYSEDVRQRPEDYQLLQQATDELEEILGDSATEATAEWSCREDREGRLIYSLTLRDFTGEMSRQFAPDELRSPNLMRFGLYRIWGDLLQAANKRRVAKFAATED